jgi:hypothetical protein
VQTVNFTQPSASYIITAIPCKTVVGRGYTSRANVTVANQGGSVATFNVTLCANSTIIRTFANVTLAGNSITTLTNAWNTTAFTYGNYVISAYLTPVSGTNMANVNCTGCKIALTIPGGINGDGVVNGKDLHILATLLLETAPPAPANVDIGGYGLISGKDLHILAQHWLQ